MSINSLQHPIDKLIRDFNFFGDKKYKLIVILGLLGDFDSIEYAQNLKKYIDSHKNNNLNIFLIAIGNKNGKEKFCKFTGFPKENLEVVSDNTIHNSLMISKGIEVGLGGWLNMLLMLSGINSLKTIKEVMRGYTGDLNAEQIFSESDNVNILKFIKFKGKAFNEIFGSGYLRPFELATFRLNNMIEIIKNWEDYILNVKFLPQRGATFILNEKEQIIFQYSSKEVLGYSQEMNDPLKFLTKVCK